MLTLLVLRQKMTAAGSLEEAGWDPQILYPAIIPKYLYEEPSTHNALTAITHNYIHHALST